MQAMCCRLIDTSSFEYFMFDYGYRSRHFESSRSVFIISKSHSVALLSVMTGKFLPLKNILRPNAFYITGRLFGMITNSHLCSKPFPANTVAFFSTIPVVLTGVPIWPEWRSQLQGRCILSLHIVKLSWDSYSVRADFLYCSKLPFMRLSALLCCYTGF